MVSLYYNKLIDHILNNTDICSLYCPKNNSSKKPFLSINNTNDKFLPFDFLSSLLCSFDGVFNIVKNVNYKNDDLNKWITNIKYLTQTKTSIVYQANVFDQNILILKNVNSNIEYFIGVFCCNKLRKLIPNFSYVLGTFKLFSIQQPTISIIYEKIPGLTFEHIIRSKEFTYKDCLSYFIQILLSLLVAQNEYGYVHNDLHTNNIILRDIIGQQTIKYFINGTTYSLNVNKIATIIDYGQSQFVYDGIFINGTIILSGKDLYMIIYTMLDNLFFYNRSIYYQMNWILDFYKNDKYQFYKYKNDEKKMTELTEHGVKVNYRLNENDKECYINLQKYIDFIVNSKETKDQITITNEHFPPNLLCDRSTTLVLKQCNNLNNIKFKTQIVNDYKDKLIGELSEFTNKKYENFGEFGEFTNKKENKKENIIDPTIIFKINNELNNIEQKIIKFSLSFLFSNSSNLSNSSNSSNPFQQYNEIKLLINKFILENIKILNLKDQAETYILYGTVLQELKNEIIIEKYKTIYWIINTNKKINQLIGSLFALLIRQYYKNHYQQSTNNYNLRKIIQDELSRYNVSDINIFLLKNI